MIIGIDLGTTNSLACYFDEGEVKIIPNRLGENLTPSVVSIDEDDNIYVGKVAKERKILYPNMTAEVFKRSMGTDKEFILGDKKFKAEELSSFVLKSLKEDAEVFIGQKVEEAIISVPAYFNDEQRKATKKAIQIAEEAGNIISFDPNLREPLWNSLDEAKEQILYGLSHCHILKISDNEIQWLTGQEDYTDGVKWILERYQIPLILVSMGKEGSRAYYGGKMVEVKPFIQKNTIETTGAGDTFCGCVLHYICEHGLDNLTEENLFEMLQFANAAASIITTRKGALRVMPEEKEIAGLLGK